MTVRSGNTAVVSAQETTALGVRLHGIAGDLAAAQVGEIGLTAGDIIDFLPAAIRELEELQ